MAEENTEQIEKSARTLGWVPEDEFRGDPDKWREAGEFVERGTSQLPIMRENIDRLMKKFDSATSEISSLKSDIKVMGDFNRKADERAFKKAEKEYEVKVVDLKKQIKQATKDGDEADLDVIEAEIDSLEKPEKPVDVKPETTPQDPEFTAWQADNKWFGTDIRLTSYATGIERELGMSGSPLKGKALFDVVAEEVKKAFPDHPAFVNPNRKKPNTVDGGGDTPPVKTGGKKYADLPDDAKKQCEVLVKRWDWYKKEDFLKEYDWEEK